jgi:hypothetical protein
LPKGTRALAAALTVIGLVCLIAQASAAPWAGAAAGKPGMQLLMRVHGFHCREELGWDPRSTSYRLHRHEGICRDYGRCLHQHKRCIFMWGRGWDSWNYESWGWDNWRYTACMLRHGCY